MKVLNKDGHRNCIHFEENVLPTVEVRNLEQEHEEEIIFHRNEIVFMIAGEMRLTFRDQPEKAIRKGEFFFIPVGGILRYKVLEKMQVTIIRLNVSIKLCDGFHIEELYRQGGGAGQEELTREIYTLKVNRPLRYFINGLNEIVHSGLNCREYFDTKTRELFILLKAFYPGESLRNFFSQILTPDTAFSEYVRANCHRFRTIGELASQMKVTPKHFERVFSRVFGMPPGRWLNREKAQMLYHELRAGEKPLKQIAHEYGFSSQPQLNRFCKRELKKNPGEIRAGKK